MTLVMPVWNGAKRTAAVIPASRDGKKDSMDKTYAIAKKQIKKSQEVDWHPRRGSDYLKRAH